MVLAEDIGANEVAGLSVAAALNAEVVLAKVQGLGEAVELRGSLCITEVHLVVDGLRMTISGANRHGHKVNARSRRTTRCGSRWRNREQPKR